MASGTITGTTSNQYIDAKIEWSSAPEYSTNKSTVTAALYYRRNNTEFTTYGSGNFGITINDKTTGDAKDLVIGNVWVKAVEGVTTVTHNSDGTKVIIISATGSIPGTTLTSTSVTGVARLDTIPRAATIDSLSCATNYFNGTMTYKYTPKSGNYYNRCNISLNLNGEFIAVKSISLGKQTASQKTATVTLSESELATIYERLPNSTKGTLRFTFRTYSDSGYSSQVGDVGYQEITLNIPNISAIQPTATMTVSPVSSLSSPFDSLYIKGRTKVDVNFTDGEGKYGASIVSYTMSVNGKTYGSPYTSEYITTDGIVAVAGTITDSRGFSRTYTKTITFLPYNTPRILPVSGESEIVCARCDASGNLSEAGTYLRIKAKRSYSKLVSGGAQKNYCSIQYRYKATNGTYTAWKVILSNTVSGDELDTGAMLDGALLATNSYVVQVCAIDSLAEKDITTINISTDKVYMHKAGSKNSLGIGKYVEEDNTIDIASDITTKFKGKVMFEGEAWTNLGLSSSVAESESDAGRWGGTGCYYRACAGEKHVYVAFNCAFTYSGSPITVNAEPIPSAYRPDRNVYALCATGGRTMARILVNKSGYILVDWIQVISSAEQTASSTVKWIDGYIDYWT